MITLNKRKKLHQPLKDTLSSANIYKNSMTKGVFLLPNLITSLSLLSGFYSIINSIEGKYWIAGWLIIASIFFDGIDGKVARLTNTSSKFGIEYDSLSDLIAFGAAPSVLLFKWVLIVYGRLGWAAVFVYLLGAALRLARFNVQRNSVEYNKFTGLPSPAAAGTVVSFLFFMAEFSPGMILTSRIILVLTVVAGLLMISNIGYFAMKDFSVFKRRPFEFLVLFSLSLIIIIVKPVESLFTIFFLYSFVSPLLYFYLVSAKIKSKKETE
ncbi:MAG: CDP-diacylglycerol--serine O-phosphatidyltransferase [bacterium]